MLQKYQQVPVTSGITNINYMKSTHTTKDLQTREALTGKKYNKKNLHCHKLRSFLQPFFFTQLDSSGEKKYLHQVIQDSWAEH